MSVPYNDILQSLPPEWPEDLLPSIRDGLSRSDNVVVVLDDDPTGTQTVADVPILTGWSVDELADEFEKGTPLVFVLTNSRSLTSEAAVVLAGELGTNLNEASQRTGRKFTIISRSDSTLRGHFPAEVDALENALGEQGITRVIIPFFLEGGRYTINDIHYVREGDMLVPAGETPFARDAVFGYQSSNLCDWVEEKTAGRILSGDVVTVSIDDIRIGGPEKIVRKINPDGAPPRAVIVNAAGYRDLEVVTRALMDAEEQGRRFMYRTAASFVRVRAGLSSRPLLTKSDLAMQGAHGGLIIVGSYVPKSSAQLDHLITHGDVRHVELNVARLLDSAGGSEIARVTAVAMRELASGHDVVVYTSRGLVRGHDDASNLGIGGKVSRALVGVVKTAAFGARYILAKGGITSSDIATDALGVKRAGVLGQILPGVPVWKLGEESVAPGIPYIVFPGNVGGDDALTTVVNKLAYSDDTQS